jgi:hypothetical protein
MSNPIEDEIPWAFIQEKDKPMTENTIEEMIEKLKKEFAQDLVDSYQRGIEDGVNSYLASQSKAQGDVGEPASFTPYKDDEAVFPDRIHKEMFMSGSEKECMKAEHAADTLRIYAKKELTEKTANRLYKTIVAALASKSDTRAPVTDEASDEQKQRALDALDRRKLVRAGDGAIFIEASDLFTDDEVQTIRAALQSDNEPDLTAAYMAGHERGKDAAKEDTKELVEALENALHYAGSPEDWVRQAESAIAKHGKNGA